ncbi:UbiE/COQ5 methyltransferase [Candidatus Koribacter versatilis Ellin345]|uniref:UbiE/COQ5 methyltransferase n=1 Tax=Koribacter versatilis (strain Ellin345) TaxID=204669 RepID=Q1ITJ7_KORVE|nr:methyltransferase domain-containing protein [Candidatus Koribacter versatilis]ABF39803.1 UbiE/COQ5 methyltransferase [Candidatus Koribacter versatilis Ellin345]
MGVDYDMALSDLIRDQFTFQAAAYANAQPIRNEEILQRIVAAADPQVDDEALDVASGPGILTCALAAKVLHATGIDLTPAMLAQSRKLQAGQGLMNLTWVEGDVAHLPFSDASFTLVTCRYAFHHFSDPLTVLLEMKRVCKSGGRILVVDTAPAREKADAFNQMEKLRDNSHVRALPVEEMVAVFESAGLAEPKVETLRMAGDLNSLLARSLCQPGDEERCRCLYEESLGEDRIDMQPRREGDNILYAFPVALFVAPRS